VVKYFILRSQRIKHLDFDLGAGLINLLEEFADLEEDYYKNKLDEVQKKIFELSQTGRLKAILPKVPIRHLLTVIQAAQNDEDEIFRLLEKTGHVDALKNKQLLMVQSARLGNWLKKYAPDEFKFSICENLPDVARRLSVEQKRLLIKIANLLESQWLSPEELHNKIYQLGKELNLDSRQTFQAIYLVLLGQDSGPKAGWFLSILDKDFVIRRLKEAAL
jgi:lysyl-tRNA synthetase class 1